jgi:hypothetical protein
MRADSLELAEHLFQRRKKRPQAHASMVRPIHSRAPPENLSPEHPVLAPRTESVSMSDLGMSRFKPPSPGSSCTVRDPVTIGWQP